jgi:thioredoxin-like negative regulator of GroEL
VIERLAVLLVLSLAAAGAYYALRALHTSRIQPHTPEGDLPALLYFRGDSCTVCPAQGRAIDQLAAEWAGRLRVERIDAEREPGTAARYGVFTLPTTIWLDGRGHVRQINYGLARADKLSRQLAALVTHDNNEGRQYALDHGRQTTDHGW